MPSQSKQEREDFQQNVKVFIWVAEWYQTEPRHHSWWAWKQWWTVTEQSRETDVWGNESINMPKNINAILFSRTCSFTKWNRTLREKKVSNLPVWTMHLVLVDIHKTGIGGKLSSSHYVLLSALWNKIKSSVTPTALPFIMTTAMFQHQGFSHPLSHASYPDVWCRRKGRRRKQQV